MYVLSVISTVNSLIIPYKHKMTEKYENDMMNP
jgi:hypothetical protein